jgi:squalene/oxidosqualene cyclase-like protein
LACGEDVLQPFAKTLTLAHDYVNITQVQMNVPNRERYYRHESKGAWPFSTVDHGWPIADCTGEGLKAALLLQDAKWVSKRSEITTDRLEDAVDMILSYQNLDGGWATYELTRGPTWLEFLNPSEIFGDIMIDYSYCECSSSSITALCKFRELFPSYRRAEVDRAISRGISFIKSIQRHDGSWYGSWGVCFLYGTWFSIEALVAAGESVANSISVSRACEFVVSKQRLDGSWGESYMSSQDKVYSQADEGQVIHTGWAMLVLSLSKWPSPEPILRGAKFLRDAQHGSGDWSQQLICGVFNKNCMISYSQYRNIFPIWALASTRQYLKELSKVKV